MSGERVHIALVANDRYRPGLLVTRRSMELAHAAAGSRADTELAFHEFGDRDMEPFLGRVTLADYNGSKLPYLRLFLPELLPACDWVLYADVDTIWERDPAELWAERDETRAICWVRDLRTSQMDFERWCGRDGRDYACSGVCLINLRRWREEGITEQALGFLRTHGRPPYADQDVMNALLAGKAKLLDRVWDTMVPMYFPKPCVYHLTGIGLRFDGDGTYDGSIPQYVIWFGLYRRWILGLSPQRLRLRVRGKLMAMAFLAVIALPPLTLADRLARGYSVKKLIMRCRRQLGYARLWWERNV